MPRQVDHDERRQELSTAVWRVVSERGLDGLTLRSVAAAAGCTTGLVAHYFADKNALLTHARDVMDRSWPPASTRCRRNPTPAPGCAPSCSRACRWTPTAC